VDSSHIRTSTSLGGTIFLGTKAENLFFADAIREGKPSAIPADEMLLTNVIIQGLIDSAEAGREVDVSVPEV